MKLFLVTFFKTVIIAGALASFGCQGIDPETTMTEPMIDMVREVTKPPTIPLNRGYYLEPQPLPPINPADVVFVEPTPLPPVAGFPDRRRDPRAPEPERPVAP